ncbi:hypothetical protein NA57DRAFT_78633 [Rhizodiscina lignyota]|uniref:Methyltransferase domain-containing protein n=1 Tax=Rhizodiscina lignyota TaxID=1504668 RepID=A0A9P4I636_9PEZI|nr:hypothetical protein NA57DRAFT_78633 [Rhizodiscina lignyota]
MADSVLPQQADLSPEEKRKNPFHLEFYGAKPNVVKDSSRALLREYSKIPNEEIDEWLQKIRQEAFSIFPYPCIGMYRFLDLMLPSTSVYDEVLMRIKDGEKFLDLGCCFGQEIRQLVFDGALPENLYRCDLHDEFLQLGYKLFEDTPETMKATFFPAGVFDDSSVLTKHYGKFSIIYTGSFFHLFDYNQQLAIAHRVIQLLAPKPDTLVIGQQLGNDPPGLAALSGFKGERPRYRHNSESWKELWDRVGKEVGMKFRTEVVVGSPCEGVQTAEKGLMQKREDEGAIRMRLYQDFGYYIPQRNGNPITRCIIYSLPTGTALQMLDYDNQHEH